MDRLDVRVDLLELGVVGPARHASTPQEAAASPTDRATREALALELAEREFQRAAHDACEVSAGCRRVVKAHRGGGKLEDRGAVCARRLRLLLAYKPDACERTKVEVERVGSAPEQVRETYDGTRSGARERVDDLLA